MRILVTVNDAYGHVLPLAGTVGELVRRGHDVVLASPGDTAAKVGLDDMRTWRYDPVPTPPRPDPPPPGAHAERLAWAVRTSWPHVARAWIDALLADAVEFRPDVVVCEPVDHAGRIVAAVLGARLVEHGWGFTLPAGGARAATAGLADLYAAYGADARDPDRRVELGPLCPPDAEPVDARFRYAPWSPPAAPLPPPSGPRIVLTLGTFPHPGADERLRAAASAASGLGAELVVALGHADRGSEEGLPADALVVPWLDLPAEAARGALVIHHAGAGSSWAAAAAGVPAVCLPQAGDQFYNADRLAAAGAAAVVPPETVDVASLRPVFAGALADAGLRAGAAALRAANDALPDVTALAALIETG